MLLFNNVTAVNKNIIIEDTISYCKYNECISYYDNLIPILYNACVINCLMQINR